jgi:cell division septum initiation protein DivIVA
MDMDDYINLLIKENETLKNTIESLKKEIRTQRKEVAALREERSSIINHDKLPGYDPEWNISMDESDSKKLGLI